MTREFIVVIGRDEEGYLVGSVPSLKGCHTQAKSMDQLIRRMKEAILLCLDEQGEETSESLELVGIQNCFPSLLWSSTSYCANRVTT